MLDVADAADAAAAAAEAAEAAAAAAAAADATTDATTEAADVAAAEAPRAAQAAEEAADAERERWAACASEWDKLAPELSHLFIHTDAEWNDSTREHAHFHVTYDDWDLESMFAGCALELMRRKIDLSVKWRRELCALLKREE